MNDLPFSLTDQEAKALYSFLLKSGYISYEFDMPVIEITRRLSKYLEELEEKENDDKNLSNSVE